MLGLAEILTSFVMPVVLFSRVRGATVISVSFVMKDEGPRVCTYCADLLMEPSVTDVLHGEPGA